MHTTPQLSVSYAAGNQQELHAVLARAVEACPNSVVLWLMNAKEHWNAKDVPAARAALEEAHTHNPESEDIVLAAFKLEFENGEAERARVIAIRAKDSLADASPRVWMKAAVASRELGHHEVLFLTSRIFVILSYIFCQPLFILL